MRKTTSIVVALVVALCCVFTMVACNDSSGHTHDYDSAWTYNSTHHWHECKGDGDCDAIEKDKATHIDEDENGKCDVCDYAMNSGEPVGKAQYAKVLNAFVNYFEPQQQAQPQAVAKRRGMTSSVLPEEITLDDILTYTLDTTTPEGVNMLVLPLTYSYLLKLLCDNDDFVIGENPVQFVATIQTMTMTFVCDFDYDTTADKLALDMQVKDVVAQGVSTLLHCEIFYDEDTDEVGDFLIHAARIGASGINGSIESYSYLSIRNHEGALKMCESDYYVKDGRMEMEDVDEFATEFGTYHIGLLDGLADDFNERAENKDVLQNNFANEFMQAGQYINDLIYRMVENGGQSGGGDVAVENITLDGTMLEMDVDDYKQLNVQFNPSNATNKTVVWQSSNEEVATVDNGKVHALKEGEATITATTANGKSATCLIKVNGATSNSLTEEEWQTALSKDSFTNFVASMTMTGENGTFVVKADLKNSKYYYNNNQGDEYYFSNENDVYYAYERRANDSKFSRSETTQKDFESQLWLMESMMVLTLSDSFSQFAYDANYGVYTAKGVLLAGANYDVTLGFKDGKLVSADINLGEDIHLITTYTYGNAVVELPTDFVEGSSGGDVKPSSLTGKTFVSYDVTAVGMEEAMLASLREEVIGSIMVSFKDDTHVTLTTAAGQTMMVQEGTYIVEGNTITVTIVSGTMNGEDATEQMKGQSNSFTVDGDILTMQINIGEWVVTYYFREK